MIFFYSNDMKIFTFHCLLSQTLVLDTSIFQQITLINDQYPSLSEIIIIIIIIIFYHTHTGFTLSKIIC